MLRSITTAALFLSLVGSTTALAKRTSWLPETCPEEFEKGHARYLLDNQDAWHERVMYLFHAKKSIVAQYYILNNDEYGRTFLALLMYKARQGKSVRLMVDAGGTKSLARTLLGSDLLQELVAAGVEVVTYAPFIANGAQSHLTARNHDKVIIVDDCYVFAGGRNIAQYYFQTFDQNPTAYVDADVVVASRTAARRSLLAFDSEATIDKYRFKVGADLLGNWRSRQNELNDVLSQHLHRATMASRKKGETTATFDVHNVSVRVLDNRSALHNRFRMKSNEITDRMLHRIGEAKSEILILNPYVVLTPAMKEALQKASERNVAISIVTNSPTSTDSLLTQAIFNYEWRQLLASIPKLRIFVARGPEKVHAKVFVADRNYAIVGSYNMDFISEQINSELSIEIEDSAFAKRVASSIAQLVELRGVEYRNVEGGGPEQIPDSYRDIRGVERMELLARLLRPLL